MKKISVQDITQYPTYHVKVEVEKICIICNSKYTWDDFYRTLGRSRHAEPNNGICSDCQHWTDNLMADLRCEDFAIIKGNHYRYGAKLENYEIKITDNLEDIIENFKSEGSVKGMGGQGVGIRYHTGEIVITDDLWHQGDIPEHFKQYPGFKDNAEFI